MDSQVHGELERFEGSTSRLLAPGEQVCALQYRKLSYRWFSRGVVETSRLLPTPYWLRWGIDRRYTYKDEDEEEDVDASWTLKRHVSVIVCTADWSLRRVRPKV